LYRIGPIRPDNERATCPAIGLVGLSCMPFVNTWAYTTDAMIWAWESELMSAATRDLIEF